MKVVMSLTQGRVHAGFRGGGPSWLVKLSGKLYSFRLVLPHENCHQPL